ncbi:LuxR C-terminal-related transcriptional regulator [Streptomyces sp. NPDC018029]|uniref:helix-turn-helix transcriptional regulator n=1 Tax=Streptomyces sp. NPDC018029 TaxID=3365032 RepID=UPI0037AE9AF4
MNAHVAAWGGKPPDLRSGHASRSSASARTPLVGRRLDLLDLSVRLKRPTARLITLVGPGGVGKTRLAEAAVAHAAVPVLRHVDAHEIETPQALAEAMDVPPPSAESWLVLDGFELSGYPASAMVDALLDERPLLRILATGRRPLHAHGEQVVPVRPLSAPPPPYHQDVSELQEHPAVTLFVDRARRIIPSFALTEDNARTVAEICARLDGIPLAVELAANRLRLFDLDVLLTRLRDGRPVLGGSHPARLPRHRSISAISERSYDRLDEHQLALLTRLSVAVGGMSLTTVGELWGLPADRAEETVEALAAHALLRVHTSDAETRCSMYHIVRESGLERLEAAGTLDQVRDQHAEHFLALALRAEPHLAGPRQHAWLDRLATDHDNVRAALSHLTARGRRHDTALAALALRRYWLTRGHLATGERWLADASAVFLTRAGQRHLTARAEAARGALALAAGDSHLAADCFQRAAIAHAECGQRHQELTARTQLAAARPDMASADSRALAEHVLTAARTSPAPEEVGEAALALAARARHTDSKLASELLDAAETVYARAQDVRGQGLVLVRRADVSVARGDQERAESLLHEGLLRLQAVGERTMLPPALEARAYLLWQRLPEQGERIARILAASTAIREATGANPLPASAVPATAVRELRAFCSGPEYEAVRREGRALTPRAAAQEALAAPLPTGPAPAATPESARLSARQYEVALLVSNGLTNRQIAARLKLSEWTVVNHVRHIMRRLDVPSRVHIAQWVAQQTR